MHKSTETKVVKQTLLDQAAARELKNARNHRERKLAYISSRENHIKALEEEKNAFVLAGARCSFYLRKKSTFLHNDYVLDQIQAEILVARKRRVGEVEKTRRSKQIFGNSDLIYKYSTCFVNNTLPLGRSTGKMYKSIFTGVDEPGLCTYNK